MPHSTILFSTTCCTCACCTHTPAHHTTTLPSLPTLGSPTVDPCSIHPGLILLLSPNAWILDYTTHHSSYYTYLVCTCTHSTILYYTHLLYLYHDGSPGQVSARARLPTHTHTYLCTTHVPPCLGARPLPADMFIPGVFLNSGIPLTRGRKTVAGRKKADRAEGGGRTSSKQQTMVCHVRSRKRRQAGKVQNSGRQALVPYVHETLL